jgi:hypothetical protein
MDDKEKPKAAHTGAYMATHAAAELPKELTQAFDKIEKIDGRNVVIPTKRQLMAGKRIGETRKSVQKAYFVLDRLLPRSVACVERVLFDEMRKKKRDGWLVLAITKFLASRRMPEVGKIEAEQEEGVKVELNLPRPKRETRVQITESDLKKEKHLRFTTNRPLDLIVRTEKGTPVELEDIKEEGVVDIRGEANTYGFDELIELEAEPEAPVGGLNEQVETLD